MSRQFVDGVKDVFVIGGIARIELFELLPQPGSERAGAQPDLKPEQTVSLAMPVEAFFKAVELLEKVRDDLRQGARGNVPDSARGGSPNFS
jgi:hypothetical protein